MYIEKEAENNKFGFVLDSEESEYTSNYNVSVKYCGYQWYYCIPFVDHKEAINEQL